MLYSPVEVRTSRITQCIFVKGLMVSSRWGLASPKVMKCPESRNVPLLGALWSLLDGVWGIISGSGGVLARCQRTCILTRLLVNLA